jgi:pre-rRNA-processing protein TSR1
LLQHESKLTVMHYGVTKDPGFSLPLKSKTPLWFHVGFRRERGAPIFSADSLGDKHKFERFLHARRPSVASVYGPVTYGPAPVLGFKEEVVTVDGVARMSVSLALVGTVRKADPDRVALKRVILTGVPFKTHKSKAVVRFMFHNPDDIRWFKPLELWTKYGMRGKIKDAIGTHGHMKCLFNGVIQQRDTICATMYKRVYPKFPLA